MRHSKLEQAAREVIRQHSMECLSDKAVDSLREALAEQSKLTEDNISHRKLEQEPVAWMDSDKWFTRNYDAAKDRGWDWTPLYAATVRTKDLTDDEIESIMVEQGDLRTIAFARAVIAADREKNRCQH